MFLFWQLYQQLVDYLPRDQVDEIAEAFLMAADGHESQIRSSGEPYITHPVAVACLLADMHMDKETVMAALMHDLVEDTSITEAELAERFGSKVAELVNGVTKLTKIKFNSKEEAQAENFRKMMLAMVGDIRVIIIKLADRMHNMQTLDALRPDKRRRIARETLEIYAPIANRLGMNLFKNTFQDLGFKAMYPFRYRVLAQRVMAARGTRRKLFEKIQQVLADFLLTAGLNTGQVLGREKRLFSIYRKMRYRGIPFSEIMDVYGFRIIAADTNDCYRLLGHVHHIFKPVPGRFKDYIAIPKANGYQSLHTTLFGPHGVPIEIQIRTQEMDNAAENGIAAHWLYKSRGFASATEVKTREWLQHLLDMQKQSGTSMEFIENVKIDLYPDEVYVFTPKGDIMELPKGATPVDFAYAVHTEVGNRCVAARVNRRLVPLSFPLTNGQTVEIKTDSEATPNPAWLNFIVTGKAKGAVKHFLKNRREQEVWNLGRRLLDHALQQLDICWDALSDTIKYSIVSELQLEQEKQLFYQLGTGQRSAAVVAQQINNTVDQAQTELPLESRALLIEGLEGMNLNFSRCCSPIPGDDVRGVINQGAGIDVHTADCPILKRMLPRLPDDQLVLLQWSDHIEAAFPVYVILEALNRRGVIAQIALLLEREGVDIRGFNVIEIEDLYGVMRIEILVKSRQHLALVIKRIRNQSFAMRVFRDKNYVELPT